MPDRLRGREDTGVMKPGCSSVRAGTPFEELLTDVVASGSTMVIGTRRRFGGALPEGVCLEADTSMGVLFENAAREETGGDGPHRRALLTGFCVVGMLFSES